MKNLKYISKMNSYFDKYLNRKKINLIFHKLEKRKLMFFVIYLLVIKMKI